MCIRDRAYIAAPTLPQSVLILLIQLNGRMQDTNKQLAQHIARTIAEEIGAQTAQDVYKRQRPKRSLPPTSASTTS